MRGDDLDAALRIVDRSAESPVILHAPHASTAIPPQHRAAFTVSDDELRLELLRLTDHATDWIVERVGGASSVVHGISRLLVDVERFDGDEEGMNAVGMGVLYTHGSQRQPIRVLDDAQRRPLMTYYRRYAERFADLVDQALDVHDYALIVDVHSYPPEALPYELHRADRRPELCIGVDRRHTPRALVRAVRSAFTGWVVAEDQPFRGSYVPLRHLGDERVSSVMLEIRRDRYLDRLDVPQPGALESLAQRIEALVGGGVLGRRPIAP